MSGNTPVLVLVVDDEDMILIIVEEALKEAGFAVERANGPDQAMKLLDQKHAELRAVVTDVNMGTGRPTGWDIARHARGLSPNIAVVYMTGDGSGDWSVDGVPLSLLITKPFAPAQIVTAVSQLLNSSGCGAAS